MKWVEKDSLGSTQGLKKEYEFVGKTKKAASPQTAEVQAWSPGALLPCLLRLLLLRSISGCCCPRGLVVANLTQKRFAIVLIFAPPMFCTCTENHLLASLRRLSHVGRFGGISWKSVCLKMAVKITVSKGSDCLLCHALP